MICDASIQRKGRERGREREREGGDKITIHTFVADEEELLLLYLIGIEG